MYTQAEIIVFNRNAPSSYKDHHPAHTLNGLCLAREWR